MKKIKHPKRLRREDSFLGIHFDFHAGQDCKEVGKNVTPKMIEHIIDEVKPDCIQCYCRGHRGFSSYPTKVGNAAPGFVKDQLRIWREVTAMLEPDHIPQDHRFRNREIRATLPRLAIHDVIVLQ